MTRLDCVLGSAGQMRAALSQAAFYAAHRQRLRPAAGRAAGDDGRAGRSGGGVLGGHPDRDPAGGPGAIRHATRPAIRAAAALLRLALPVAKFWICKRAVPMIAEALECLGGNGYVETFPMARLLRESPLNGIWEGSGTVTALDAVRALQRNPASGDALLAETPQARGVSASVRRRAVDDLEPRCSPGVDPAQAGASARWPPALFAASLLIRQAPAEVADLYCATRLGGPATGCSASCRRPDTRCGSIVDAVTPRLN